ncbi:hypothetical protein ONZ51_g7590 [Trametes cubensis]|uniref:Uncharacterized protein n=1 Tax=Trametes cubensis TaxID=1111947 RepID=A0AAD7TQ77_9APHY|nr:hypothetical protein ONZ51_g7590 [Trametes cubensis]
MHEFPVPIGGAPLPIDFAPSIVFVVLYALLLPIIIMRVLDRRARCIVLVGTAMFAIEHIVTFSLRAYASRNAGPRVSPTLEQYFQATFGGGFISIGQDVTNLFRALLVSTTFPTAGSEAASPPSAHSAGTSVAMQASSAGSSVDARQSTAPYGGDEEQGKAPSSQQLVCVAQEAHEDQPVLRKHIRTCFGIMSILFLAAVALGIVAGVDFKSALQSGANSDLVRQTRYASAGITVAFLACLLGITVYVLVAVPRVPKFPVLYLCIVCLLIMIVGLYRIGVTTHSTTSLLSTAPGSQNTTREKIAFWILHAAPEWISAAMLLGINCRRTFKTGFWGDRNSDKPVVEV